MDLFGMLQVKQQINLMMRRKSPHHLWTYFRENCTVVTGNKHQVHYIAMLPKSDCNMPGDASISASKKYVNHTL